VALELPGWVVIAFNYAGLPWPGIDEDELRAWAASVRTFAGNITGNSARTRGVVAGVADSSQSSFTAAMDARWERHSQLIADLHEPLNVFADALDVAADVVVAQKMVVIGAAVAFATEFAATQVGAIFTLGADEAALPEEIISTREIVNFAIEELKGALIGELLNVAVQGISDHVSGFIGSLFGGGLQVVTEYQSLKISYDSLRDAAQTIRGQAAETQETGDAAYAENANRDLEDPGEGGVSDDGWASVVQAVKQALLDLAVDLFKSLPQVIVQAQEDTADAFDAAAANISDADNAAGHAAPHDSGQGPAAEPGTAVGPSGTGIVEPEPPQPVPSYTSSELMALANDKLSDTGSEVHPNVPEWATGDPTRGVFSDGVTEVPLRSQTPGPGQWFHEQDNFPGGPGSGRTFATTHVEGHAAGVMQQLGITDADLYINRATGPCAQAAQCRYVLYKLVPEGAELRVHFPDGVGGTHVWKFQGGVPRWVVVKLPRVSMSDAGIR
jgi:hypothetical protein